MSEAKTKACNLTEKEIRTLIAATMSQTLNIPINDVDLDSTIERINYLNKRLKTFSEPEKVEEAKPEVATPIANSG